MGGRVTTIIRLLKTNNVKSSDHGAFLISFLRFLSRNAIWRPIYSFMRGHNSEFLQYRLSAMINAKASFESKDKIDWVFRSDHVTLAFTVSKRCCCKNSLISRCYQIS